MAANTACKRPCAVGPAEKRWGPPASCRGGAACLALVLCLLAAGASGAHAQSDDFWTGAGDGWNWHDPLNWKSGSVPDEDTNVFLLPGSHVLIAQMNAHALTVNVEPAASLTIEGVQLDVPVAVWVAGETRLDPGSALNTPVLQGDGAWIDVRGGNLTCANLVGWVNELLMESGSVVVTNFVDLSGGAVVVLGGELWANNMWLDGTDLYQDGGEMHVLGWLNTIENSVFLHGSSIEFNAWAADQCTVFVESGATAVGGDFEAAWSDIEVVNATLEAASLILQNCFFEAGGPLVLIHGEVVLVDCDVYVAGPFAIDGAVYAQSTEVLVESTDLSITGDLTCHWTNVGMWSAGAWVLGTIDSLGGSWVVVDSSHVTCGGEIRLESADLTLENNSSLACSDFRLETYSVLAMDGQSNVNVSYALETWPETDLAVWSDSSLTAGEVLLGGDLHLSQNAVIDVDWTFTQASGSNIDMAITATEHPRITARFDVTLEGTLSAWRTGQAIPPLGTTFEIITGGSGVYGGFAAAAMPWLNDDLVMELHYGPSAGGGASGGGGAEGVFLFVNSISNPIIFGDPFNVFITGRPTAIAAGRFDVTAVVDDLAITVAAPNPLDPGSVVLLLNQGGGAFDVDLITVGREPSGLVVADLTGVNGADIAVANEGDDTLTILHNDGFGGFSSTEVNVGSQPSAVVAGDFRGLGVLDLAVACRGDDTVLILLNDGSGAFTPGQALIAGAGPSAIVAADFNGDGAIDLAVANEDGNSVFVFKNISAIATAEFEFFGSISVSGPHALTAEDIEDNKDIDLLIASPGSVVIARNMGGDGGFAQPISMPVGGPVIDIDTWDMDGDGDADLAVIVEDENVGAVVRVFRNDGVSGGTFVFTVLEDIGGGEEPVLVAGADVTSNPLGDLVTVNVGGSVAGGSAGTRSGARSGVLSGARSVVPAAAHSENGGETWVTIRPNMAAVPSIPGDLNGDGHVDVQDLLILLSSWGQCPKPPAECPADINNSGAVDVQDLLILLANWG